MPSTPNSTLFGRSQYDLTPTQKLLYASERAPNYRQIAKLFATRSKYTLSPCDLVPSDVQLQLAEFGEFAEMAYGDAEFIYGNIEMLTQTDFPLEGYNALRQAKLVAAFQGTVADVPGCVSYRAETKQLVIGFSGTATVRQLLFDLYATKVAHPAGQGSAVHSGFWKMYLGCKTQIFTAIHKAVRKYDVAEVVSVGHSMGAALSYLLALDLICSEALLSSGLTLTVAAFGSPRVGNARLYDRWQEMVESYRSFHGDNSVKEYLVKANNDGVHTIPTESLGYRHLARIPLYLYHGRLFYIPNSEREHGDFTVSTEALDQTRPPDHPRGGHQYYNCRSFEKVVLRMFWLNKMMKAHPEGWQQAYLAQIALLAQSELCTASDVSEDGELPGSPVGDGVQMNDERSELTEQTANRSSHGIDGEVVIPGTIAVTPGSEGRGMGVFSKWQMRKWFQDTPPLSPVSARRDAYGHIPDTV
ncbi:Alpha/Beta hydrolase protein [Sparassis latifolia]